MPIPTEPFGPPRAIGQGLTGILAPYDVSPSNGGGDSGEGAQQAAAGPFGSGGPLSQQADQAREGLAQLLTAQSPSGGGSAPSLGAETSALPISSLGLPTLGGSPVSTAGTNATTAPSPSSQTANTQGGLGRLLDSGGGTGAPGSVGPGTGASSATVGHTSIPGLSSMLGINGIPGYAVDMLSQLGLKAFAPPVGMAYSMAKGINSGGNFLSDVFGISPQMDPAIAQAMNTLGKFGISVDPNQALGAVAALGMTQDGLGNITFASPQGTLGGATNMSSTGVLSGGPGQSPAPGPAAPSPSPSSEGPAAADSGEGDFKRGGLVPNLHPGAGDDEPIMAKGGEFVLRAPAVKKYGLARLTALNEGRA